MSSTRVRPSKCGRASTPTGSTWCRSDARNARGRIPDGVRRWEWLGRRDPHELRDTDDVNATDTVREYPNAFDPDRDAIDPDSHRVSNDNRSRDGPDTGHDDGLRHDDNVRSESHRGRGCSSRVAERRIEQHAMGLDRLRNPCGGRPHRRDRVVVAETLRPGEGKTTRPRRRTTSD